MQKIGLVQLNNVLIATGRPLQRRLSDADGIGLTVILEKAQRRWPTQDNAESIEEYLTDLEQLSLKYSLRRVAAALEALRIRPEQEFFPKPNEVAGEIEEQMDAERYEQKHKAAAKRCQREIQEFWKQAAEHIELAGIDEEELMRRFPGYRGTKPSPTMPIPGATGGVERADEVSDGHRPSQAQSDALEGGSR